MADVRHPRLRLFCCWLRVALIDTRQHGSWQSRSQPAQC